MFCFLHQPGACFLCLCQTFGQFSSADNQIYQPLSGQACDCYFTYWSLRWGIRHISLQPAWIQPIRSGNASCPRLHTETDYPYTGKHSKMTRYYGIYAKHHKQEPKLFRAIKPEHRDFFLSWYKWRVLMLSCFQMDPIRFMFVGRPWHSCRSASTNKKRLWLNIIGRLCINLQTGLLCLHSYPLSASVSTT